MFMTPPMKICGAATGRFYQGMATATGQQPQLRGQIALFWKLLDSRPETGHCSRAEEVTCEYLSTYVLGSWEVDRQRRRLRRDL